MNRIENYSELETRIVSWLKDYAEQFNIKAFVIGVSGGIDSAVSSTLAAKTGLPVYALGMPIYQKEEQETLSDAHLEWLESNFDNVVVQKFDLSRVFATFCNISMFFVAFVSLIQNQNINSQQSIRGTTFENYKSSKYVFCVN